MKIQRNIAGDCPWTTVSVALLRTVYLWSGRRYRRELLRRELRRIGLTLAAERHRGQPGQDYIRSTEAGGGAASGRLEAGGWRLEGRFRAV